VRRFPGIIGAVLALLPACGGWGGGEATLGIDRQALIDRGLLSLSLELYSGQDATGGLVDCDRLIANYDAAADFVPIGSSQVVNLAGEDAITIEIDALSPGIVFFLVVGYDAPDGIGTITQVGCGEGVIRRGEKTPVTVALAPVP